jgi:hypothetical protein
MRLLTLLIAIASVSLASAQETMIRQVFDPLTDTHVEVLALFSKPSPGGYLPVRVKLANNLKIPSVIRLAFKSEMNGSSTRQADSSFAFDAPAGKIITRDILVPLAPSIGMNGWGGKIECNLTGTLGLASNSISSLPDDTQPAVLLSEALFAPNASSLDAAMPATPYGGKSEFASKFDPKQLPDNWLAFSGYDCILMTDTDWTSTPSSARNAILSWVRLGGRLMIYSVGSADLKSLGIAENTSFGTAVIEQISSDLKLDPKGTLAKVNKNPNKSRIAAIHSDYDGSWPLQKHFGSQAFQYGLFIAVLILFAIIVGPVNLFVFAKSGQRHRLFITTPIISLAASLALVVLIIVQDGFGGSGMRRVLMEVRPDGDQNAAYIQQEQFCRTGVLTNPAFTMDEPSIITPVPIALNRWARFTNSSVANNNFSLQPTDGKLKATGDWFQSRSEHGHALSTVSSTRGRIESADTNTFLSTFEFPIDTLFYCDKEGKWGRAEGITTGKRFNLTPVDFSMVDPLIQPEIAAFTDRNKDTLRRIYSRAGCYIALTNSAPGIPTHPGIRWKETRTVITGPVLGVK